MNKLMMGFTACALILTSCSKTETLPVEQGSNVISFENVNGRYTKASVVNTQNYGVLAMVTGNSGIWDIFNNQLVTTSNALGVLDSYTPGKLWPASPATVDFYAYAPQGDAAIDLITVQAPPDGTITFKVPAAANVDFTVADPVLAADKTNGAVSFVFNHMLSSVKLGTVAFASGVPTAAGEYTLDASDAYLKFLVVSNAGTVNLFDPTEAWDNIAGTAAFYDNATEYFFMPQSIPNNTTVKIQLCGVDISLNGASVYNGNIKIEYVPMSAVAGAAFAKGTQYTVNFTLGSNIRKPGTGTEDPTDETGDLILDDIITFTSSATDWAPADMDISLGN